MADTSLPPLPLSTYSSPHRPTVTQWLEGCVKEAVRNLDEAPFLQLYVAGENGQPDRTERHTITPTVVQTPQVSCGPAYSLPLSAVLAGWLRAGQPALPTSFCFNK